MYCDSVEQLQQAVLRAAKSRRSLAICGQRHAGGGQQFDTGNLLIDTSKLQGVVSFDHKKGQVEVLAGTIWPVLLSYLEKQQAGLYRSWGIVQKQTGADWLSIGGALSANAHGQGLRLKPIVGDVESFTLVNAEGKKILCSREENTELFKLAIGGYGLFGAIATVTLRLVPRAKVRRMVEIMNVDQIPKAFEHCAGAGCAYGDYQCDIDEKSPDFLKTGIFSCYETVAPETPAVVSERLSDDDWVNLVTVAHADKAKAYKEYCAFYQKTSGQCNWADVWQSGPYVADYHKAIDAKLRTSNSGTEILTELYVPLSKLNDFISSCREQILKTGTNLIYSTIRFISKDDDTFLPWAKEDFACVIFNLHTEHSREGIEQSKSVLVRFIDFAIANGGSYYLTYHRYASKQQVLACYPQFEKFLQLKLKYDPQEVFQSDWYRHMKQLFA